MEWYIATETFDENNDGWMKYVEWSGLDHINEIISLDISLCPSIIQEPNDDDYKYLIDDFEFCCYFKNLNYLLERTKEIANKNILATVYEPSSEQKDSGPIGFKFIGYDLIEEFSGISALNNCGGFDKSFKDRDLNQFGILDTFSKAKAIKESLLEMYPEESHADTEIWALWRYLV